MFSPRNLLKSERGDPCALSESCLLAGNRLNRGPEHSGSLVGCFPVEFILTHGFFSSKTLFSRFFNIFLCFFSGINEVLVDEVTGLVGISLIYKGKY